jgi:hypothetical protein
MRKLLALIGLCTIACVVGAVAALSLTRERSPPPPDAPAVVEKMREVARLETLQLRLHKKISFAPDPPRADTVWGDVANWVAFSIRKPQGRAIVFAEVDLGINLERLGPDALRIEGRRVELVLPEPDAQVRLLHAETEFIGSNLDSAETAQLFDRAHDAFGRQVLADERLRRRARESTERALRALLITVGFREVVFHHQPAAPPAG